MIDRWRAVSRERLSVGVVGIGNPTVGAGFVVSSDVIITCAHVVLQAGAEPGDTVLVSFPALGAERHAKVDPQGWRERDDEDVALLRLDEPLPPGVEPLLLGSSSGLEGRELVGRGFPGIVAEWTFARVTGQISGPVPGTSLLQLRSQEIQPGFSGGPLLDETRGCVVGVIQAIQEERLGAAGRGRETAFGIPVETVGGVIMGAWLEGARDFRDLAEQLSAALLPRAGWPPPSIATDPLTSAGAGGLADVLKVCASLEGRRLPFLLSRLPLVLVDEIVSRIEGSNDRACWAQALVGACATQVAGLALLAAVLAEVEPWRTAQPVRAFAERVLAEGQSNYSEIAVREALDHAAALSADEAQRSAFAAAKVLKISLASAAAVDPWHRFVCMVRLLAGIRWTSDGLRPLQALVDTLALGSLASADVVRGLPDSQSSVPTNLPPRNELFRGRANEMVELHGLLGAEGKTGVTRRVAVWSHGGSGKTALAIEYGWQHLSDYPGGVFLVSADTAFIEPGLAALARDFDPSAAERLTGKDQTETAENVRRRLTRGPPALLILDNIRDAQQLRQWKMKLPSEACRLLLTTRSSTLPETKMSPLERLSDDDTIEVLKSRRLDAGAPEHRGSVDIVVRACDGLAVAVVAVAAYMELEKHLSWTSYADDLRRKGAAVVEQTMLLTAEGSEYPASLVVIFSDLFGGLRPPQQRCLQLAAMLPPEQAPLSWLRTLLANEPQLELGAAPAEVGPSAAVLQSLLRLQVLRASDQEGRLLTLHRLLGYWLRQSMDHNLKEALKARVIGFAQERAEASKAALTNPEVRWELGPLAAAGQLLLEWDRSDAAVRLAGSVSSPLQELGRYREAHALLTAVLSTRQGADLATLEVRHALAQTLYAEGDLAGARGHQEVVLKAARVLLGDEHPDTLTTRLSLAETLYSQGDLVGARGHQEAVFEAWGRIFGAGHPKTILARNNLARVLHAQGDLVGARGHQEAVFEAWGRIFGAGHLKTILARSNLAQTLKALGDLAGARVLEEAALEAMRGLLGDEHPETLRVRNNLAGTLYAQEDLAGARGHLETVLEARRRLLGDEHPDTLMARNNLAATLLKQGDWSAARSHQEAVLEAMRRLLGDEHPNTLRVRNNLAQTLYAQGHLVGARGHQEAVLGASRRLLGDEHPETLRVRHNLASTLYAQGDLAGARGHQQAALEGWRRSLGDKHPDTLTARSNLAQILKAQGDPTEASPSLIAAGQPSTIEMAGQSNKAKSGI